MDYLRFLRDNALFLSAGALLAFLSSFGQTFFISVFAAEIRTTYNLSHGDWGGIYSLGTMISAVVMIWAGGLTDHYRTRTLGPIVVALLGLSCIAMARNQSAAMLVAVVFTLRFFGQGMSSHLSVVSMARWFIASRGRALAVATLGFSIAEATMPLTFVWLKTQFDWRELWVGAGIFCFLMIPVLYWLLSHERTPQQVATSTNSVGMDGRHWRRGEALRHPLFWSLTPALLAFPAFGTAFWFHQVHFAEVKGWEHLKLVAVFPLGTAMFVCSTLLYGWLIDRFGTARLLPIYLLPLTVAFGLHWYAPAIGWSVVGVIMMGLAGGGQATLPAACWAEFFGTSHIGSIKSAVAAIMVFGTAIGPALSGWLIDFGVSFPQQSLGYATLFALSAVTMIPALNAAKARLPRSP